MLLCSQPYAPDCRYSAKGTAACTLQTVWKYAVPSSRQTFFFCNVVYTQQQCLLRHIRTLDQACIFSQQELELAGCPHTLPQPQHSVLAEASITSALRTNTKALRSYQEGHPDHRLNSPQRYVSLPHMHYHTLHDLWVPYPAFLARTLPSLVSPAQR